MHVAYLSQAACAGRAETFRPCALLAIGLGAALLIAPVARAEPGDALRWITLEGEPDACLDEPSLRARVAHYLAHTAVGRTCEVLVRRADEGAEFSVSRAGTVVSRRRFERLPQACADRRDTLALAIALAIEHAGRAQAGRERAATDKLAAPAPAAARAASADELSAGRETSAVANAEGTAPAGAATETPARASDSREGQASSAARAVEPTERAPEPAHASVDDAADSAESAEPLRARLKHSALQAGVRVLFEVAPVPAVAFSAGAELPFAARFRVQLVGLASLRVRSDLAPAQVHSQLVGGEALGCGRFGREVLSVHACLGLGGGALLAAGDGYAQNRAATLGWLAALARVALRWSLTRLAALQLAGGAHVNLIRPELGLLGSADSDLSAPAGGSLGLDMIVAFR